MHWHRFDHVTPRDLAAANGTVVPMLTARSGRGDDGTTDLLGRRRVSKASVAITALGDLDEATSAIGVARAYAAHGDPEAAFVLEQVQRDLYLAMAEIAIPATPGAPPRISSVRLEWLCQTAVAIDIRTPTPVEFVLPGATVVGAHLDLARTVVRRAERSVVRVIDEGRADPESGLPTDGNLLAYLNRLSTLLYLLARGADGATGLAPDLARAPR